jgi:YVTN family beta-propeller protein
VTNTGDGTVSVINGQTNTVTATVAAGNAPLGVAANPKTNTSYVANAGDGTVSVLTSCERPLNRHRRGSRILASVAGQHRAAATGVNKAH